MNENLDRDDRTSRADGPNANPGAPEGGNRKRRFLLGSLVSGSAILTLASRPALANSCTFSGMQSTNPSGATVTCAGCSPGFYHTVAVNKLYPGGLAASTPFFSIFSFLTTNTPFPTGKSVWTFFDALNKNFKVNEVNDNAFAQQCAAAYINASRFTSNPSFGYTTADIVKFIQQGVTNNNAGITDQLDKLNNRNDNQFC
jgi:hypothetical protein